MSYTTIMGVSDTAQHLADFDEAVNTAGGKAACVGGQSISDNKISQAVDVGDSTLVKLWELPCVKEGRVKIREIKKE